MPPSTSSIIAVAVLLVLSFILIFIKRHVCITVAGVREGDIHKFMVMELRPTRRMGNTTGIDWRNGAALLGCFLIPLHGLDDLYTYKHLHFLSESKFKADNGLSLGVGVCLVQSHLIVYSG